VGYFEIVLFNKPSAINGFRNLFIMKLDQYLRWYGEKRIKLSLGGMSPIDYRKSLGLIN